jgi:hypothetical protein
VKLARTPAAPKTRSDTNNNAHMMMPETTASTLFSPTVNRLFTRPPTKREVIEVRMAQTMVPVCKVREVTRSLIDTPTARPRVASKK